MYHPIKEVKIYIDQFGAITGDSLILQNCTLQTLNLINFPFRIGNKRVK